MFSTHANLVLTLLYEALPLNAYGEVNGPVTFHLSASKDKAQPQNVNGKNSVTSRQMPFPFKNQSMRRTREMSFFKVNESLLKITTYNDVITTQMKTFSKGTIS